jgi:hypothetical protein
LSLAVEAVLVVHGCEDIHQHSVVRSLVELRSILSVVFVENFSDEFKDLCHKFVLVKAEHSKEDNNKLHKAVDVSKIQSVSWPFLTTVISKVESFLYTRFDHDLAKAEQELCISVDTH